MMKMNINKSSKCLVQILFSSRTSHQVSQKAKASFSSSSFSINVPSSSNSSSNSSSSSWERGAKLVKNIDTSNQYLEHIRETHDPSMQLKTMEDELRGTMGKALGKQGDKILNALRLLEEERVCYIDLLMTVVDNDNDDTNGNSNGNANDNTNTDDSNHENHENEQNKKNIIQNMSFQKIPQKTQTKLIQTIKKYNQHRKDAIKSRWELTVHRQAVGFIVNNHRFVHEKFPIPEPLDLPSDLDVSLIDGSIHGDGNDSDSNGSSKQKKEAVVRNFGDQLDWWENIGRWR